MAARTAVATGNWSSLAVWDGGVSLPGVGDTADSNGFTVTIDQDITVTSLINTNAGAGSFACSTARVITANIVATVRTVLLINGGAAAPTVNGNLTGGNSGSASAVYASGSVPFTINGNATGGTAGNCHGLFVQGAVAQTVNLNGNVLGGSGGYGVTGDRNNIWNISGTVTGGTVTNCCGASIGTNGGGPIITIGGAVTGGGAAGAHGIRMVSSGGYLKINANVLGGTNGTAYGVHRDSGGITIVAGNITGSANAHGINIVTTSGSVTVIGGTITGGSGANVCGINNAMAGPICTTGNIVGGSAAGAYGVANASTGPVILQGTATNNTANAINHAGGGTTYTCGATGGGGRSLFPGAMG